MDKAVAGSITAYLPFAESPWYRNAATWLLSLPLVVGGLMWWLRRLNTRTVRRAVQLATILSLLVHLFMFLGSLDWWLLGNLQAKRQRNPRPQPRQIVTIPEYHAHHFAKAQDRPQEEYEKPVEAPMPEAERTAVKPEERPQPDPVRPRPGL